MNLIRFWKDLVILQTCSGSVSFIASTAIIVFIYKNGGLSNPYRRLIFGLSVADLCQSFAIVAGPWLNRSDVPQALWGMGNKHTCRFDGFILLMGMSAVPMYTLCLCIYYVCKLRDKMTDPQFTTKMEKKMHAIIIVGNLCLYFTALGMDVINSSISGHFCFAAAVPTGCRLNPAQFGECDPRISAAAQVFNIVSTFIIPSVCLIGVVVCLAMIFWNVLVMDKIFGRARNSDSTTKGRGTDIGITKRKNKFLRSMISSCNFTSYNENNDDPAAASAASCDNNDDTPPMHHGFSNMDSECYDKNDPYLFPVSSLVSENSKSPMEEYNIPITATRTIMDIPQPGNSQGVENSKSPMEEYNIPITATRTIMDIPQPGNSQGVEGVGDRDPHALSRLYKKELLIQACCYVLIFCISAVPFLILCLTVVSGNAPSPNMVRVSVFLYPLSGLFNIIVYTRPNVASLRRTFPNCSRLQAFWLVLKAGGEVPDTTKLSNANVTLWNLGCLLCPAGGRKKLHLATLPSPVVGNDLRRKKSNPYAYNVSKKYSASLPPSIVNANMNSLETVSDLRIGVARPPVISSVPDSAGGMNGMSMSFGSDNAAHRATEDWNQVEGRASITLNNIPEEAFTTCEDDPESCKSHHHQEEEEESSFGNYDDISNNNSSSISQKEENKKEEDDIWAVAFERGRNIRFSE